MNLSELKAIDSRLKRVAAGETIQSVYGPELPGSYYADDCVVRWNRSLVRFDGRR